MHKQTISEHHINNIKCTLHGDMYSMLYLKGYFFITASLAQIAQVNTIQMGSANKATGSW